MSHPLLNIFIDSNTIGVACKNVLPKKARLNYFDISGTCTTMDWDFALSTSIPIAISLFDELTEDRRIIGDGDVHPADVLKNGCSYRNFGYGTGLGQFIVCKRGRSNRWLETTIPFSCNQYGVAGCISDGYEVAITTVNL